MLSKPRVVALVAALCVAAAGGGAYMAVRHNSSAPAAQSALPSEESAPAASPTRGPEPAEAPGAAPASPAAPTSDTIVAVDEPAATPAKPASEPAKPSTSRASRRSAPMQTAARETHRAAPTAPPAEASPAPPPEPAAQPATVEPEPIREPIAPIERERAAPVRTFEELVVGADSVIGLQLETTLTTERARIEDRVDARVTRDVTVGERTAIPAGARMIGSVSLVEKGGKVRERARLGVRFHTLVLADGTTLPVETETIFRDGDSPAGQSTAKIGGAAVGGAILGAIFGGAKGAIIGGSTGAAGGTAAVMAGDRKPAVLAAGSSVTVRLSAPVTVTVERN